MKILNLFAGIGGNRTLWGDEHKITAVEYNQKIACIYHKRFPNDKIIIGDAWQYFLEHFHEFEFIWASPPCQSHTIIKNIHVGRRYNQKQIRLEYPDMRLYSLILFCKHFFRGDFVIENVIPYYKPLIRPTSKIGRHYIWSSKFIAPRKDIANDIGNLVSDPKYTFEAKGLDLDSIKALKIPNFNYLQIGRNCVPPEFGKYILEQITNKHKSILEYD